MDDKYRKIEEINLIDIYLEFDKEKLTNIFEGFNFIWMHFSAKGGFQKSDKIY